MPIFMISTAAAAPLAWGPCEDLEPPAECALVSHPLDWDDLDGPTIDVAVARLPAPVQPARGQLWFLTGGPGDSGLDDLESAASAHEVLAPDLDLLTFDHRGTGQTVRLSCPEQEDPASFDGFEIVGDEWAPCVEHLAATYGDVLPHISVRAAAKDLVALTERVADDDDFVAWWGLSYGTYLAIRALHLAPDAPDAVLLDGLVPADFDFARFDSGVDQVAREMLDACAGDAVCAAHLGPDPTGAALATLAEVEATKCGRLGLDAPTSRLLAGVFTVLGDRYPTLLPPLFHRLDRCARRDRRAFIHLFGTLFPEDGSGIAEKRGHSPAAQRHLAYGDLWGPDAPSNDALQQVVDGAVATTEVSLNFAATRDGWPGLPELDPLDGAYPVTTVPILAMHGALDPTNPVDRLDGLAAWLERPGATLIVVPNAHHVTLNHGDCPASIQAAFLADPAVAPDATCAQDLPPMDFAGDPEFDLSVWGTEDRWGDASCGCAGTPVPGAALAACGVAIAARRRRR